MSGIRVIDTIKPKNDADFAVVEDSSIKGGHVSVADAAARNAVTAAHRKAGMFVVTQDDGKVWKLGLDLTTWTEFTGGGGSSVSGTDADGAVVEDHLTTVPATPSPDFIPSSPYAVLADSTTADVLYVGNYDGRNGSTTPLLEKLTVSDGVITVRTTLDVITAVVGAIGVVDLAQDATYLYASTADGGSVIIIDKSTFTIVGYATVDAGTVCADGAGHFYTFSWSDEKVRKWLTSDHTTVPGMVPGNAIPPVATEAVSTGPVWRLRYGNGALWASVGDTNPGGIPVVRELETAGLTVTASLADFSGPDLAYGLVYDETNAALWVSGDVALYKITEAVPGTLVLSVAAAVGAFPLPSENLVMSAGDAFVLGVSGDVSGGYVGGIDTSTDSWFIEVKVNAGRTDFRGVATVGDFTYAAAPIGRGLPALSYMNITDPNLFGRVTGTVGADLLTYGLKYAENLGDVRGKSSLSRVVAIDDKPVDNLGTTEPTDGSVLVVQTVVPTISGTIADLYYDDSTGLVWVAQSTDRRLKAYNPDTMRQELVTAGGFNTGGSSKILGDDTYLYVIRLATNSEYVRIFLKSGQHAGTIYIGLGGDAVDIALDGQGFIWVADLGGAAWAIRKYDIAAAVAAYPADYTTESAVNDVEMDANAGPLSLCYGGGFLWVGEDGELIHKVDDLGVVITSYTSTVTSHACLMYVNGCVWASSRDAFVARYDPITFPAAGCLRTSDPQEGEVGRISYDPVTDTILADNAVTDTPFRWMANATGPIRFIEALPGILGAGTSAVVAVGKTGRVWTAVGSSIEVFRNDPGNSVMLSSGGMKSLGYSLLSGDVTGGLSGNTVGAIQNQAVAVSVPLDGQALTWNNGLSQWEPQTIPVSGIAPTVDVQTAGAAIGAPYAPARDAWRMVVVNQASGAAYYVNLPGTPTTGDILEVKDKKGDAAVNNITVNGNGNTIDGGTSYVIDANRAAFRFVYDGAEWGVY